MDNLARDAARVLAAGQTYGKWKAENPHTKDDADKIEIEKPEVRCCDVCGEPIPPYSRYRLRCSKECSIIGSRRRSSQLKKERKRK